MKDQPETPIHDMAEALSLSTGADYWTSMELPEHGLRSLRFADGPHGLRVQDDENPDHLGLGRSIPSTCFPPAVALSSLWDETMIAEVGQALGREARALGVDVVLGPGLNLKRSPLCGRNFEYYSEDPLLSGTLAAAFVRGLQGEGVAACLKHYAVNNQETDRLRVSAEVDERTLREIYLKGFEIAIREGGAWAVMSSYNRVNGEYVAESEFLLRDVLRDEWGFDGIVVSDWGGVRDPVTSVHAGVDLRMPGRQDDMRLRKAHVQGQVDEVALASIIEHFRTVAERTEPKGPAAPVDYEAHHALVRRVGAEAAVLLTNDGILPMQMTKGATIAVIGELARKPRFQGAGSSFVNARQSCNALSVLAAAAKAAGAELRFEPGYSLEAGTEEGEGIANAVALAEKSDIVLLFLGLPGDYEAEGRDRTHINLPQDQLKLLAALKGKAPTVVALSNGSPVSTAAWREGVNAIVEFWLTGEAHGESVLDVLTGATNPAGKLAETIPQRIEDSCAYLNFPGEYGSVTYGEGLHVGYRWHDARDLAVDFPFGHGLSYTSFAYSDLTIVVHPLEDELAFTARFTVTNTGPRAGAEVTQLYVNDHDTLLVNPPRELRGWTKVRLQPGEAREVSIEIRRDRLKHWYVPAQEWVHQGGPATIHIGSSSRDFRLEETVDLPGVTVPNPITIWSTLGEWFDDPKAGPLLKALIDERGGIRGRMGDLLSDPAGRDSALGFALASIVQFPGVPVMLEEIPGLLEKIDG